MDELKKAAAEYLALQAKCDGRAETFAAIYPLAATLAVCVDAIRHKARSDVVRYFAYKLYLDVEDMATRFWVHTVIDTPDSESVSGTIQQNQN